MNTNDKAPPELDDDDLRELAATLRGLEPTLDGRVRNRTLIAAELARLRRRQPPLPWWRRSVAIPVPVAMTACALLLVSTCAWLYGPKATVPPHQSIASSDDGNVGATTTLNPLNESNDADARFADYTASQVYLCGLGRISYESVYEFQEDL